MKGIGNLFRRILFKILPFETYLLVLSNLYFLAFNLGMLRSNRTYQYPYFLKNIIRKGDVCIDIGANLGYLSVIFSNLVGKNGKVHSVEPVRPVRSVLRKNIGNRKNVEIYPYALGEENKSIKLGNNTLDKQGFIGSGTHFVMDADANVDVEFNAEMKKGSELFSTLKKLDFIKCDIEGYELIVLKEMAAVLKKHLPTLLIETRGPNRTALLKFFGTLGYHAYILEENKLIPADDKQFWDIFFIHNTNQKLLEQLNIN